MSDSEWRMRPFRPEDQSVVYALILEGLGQRFGEIDSGLNPDLTDIQSSYVNQDATFLVVEHDSEVVGCGALILENGSREVARIVRVSVRRDQQSKGTGRAISERLIGIACERGFKRILVETNSDWDSALRLYQTCGFVEYDRVFVETFGFTEVHMALGLD
jgi:N-acetylglutamate synthase-like GNAT family acetyltransferase